jgi:hypothetical protein
MRPTYSLLLLCVLAACRGADTGPPPRPDMGTVDSGNGDLGIGADLGNIDGAVPFDAGALDDGAVAPDAALTDGSIITDAAMTDAGAHDASVDGGLVSMPCMARGACDPFVADSCPAGFSCRPNPVGVTACAALTAAPKDEGAICASAGDCLPGLLCLDFGGGATCNRVCARGALGSCSGEDRCFGTIGDVCIQVCRPRPEPCDIYTQNCPRLVDACTLATDPETRAPYTGCRLAGTAAHGDACGGASGACARGLICIREGAGSTCKQVCGPDAGAPTCTFSGETCTGFARTWGVSYCRAP